MDWVVQKAQSAVKAAEIQQINNLLQDEDDNDDTSKENQKSELTEEDALNNLQKLKVQKDPIQKFLRQVPPDFDKAEIHGVR